MSKQRIDGGMLMDDQPIMFLPKLAKCLKSCEKAIVLQQVHWLSKLPRSGIDHAGYHWVWGTYEDWCEEYFAMWHPSTLRKHIQGLEKDGYLISEQLKSSEYDRTKYYRIDYDLVASMRPDVDASERPDADDSYKGTETSSETTTDTSFSDEKDTQPKPEQTPTTSVGPKTTNTKSSRKPSEVTPPPAAPSVPTEHQEMFEAICITVGMDYKVIGEKEKGQVAQTLGILKNAGYTIEDLREFYRHWKYHDWRGLKGQEPTLSQLRAEIGKVKNLDKSVMNGNGNGNGVSVSRRIQELT